MRGWFSERGRAGRGARRLVVVLGCAGALAGGPVFAGSVLLEYAPNGVAMRADASAGFAATGSTDVDFAFGKGLGVADPTGASALTTVATLPALVSKTAPLGTGQADVAARLAFEYGVPLAGSSHAPLPGASLVHDRLSFVIDPATTFASALSAQNHLGNDANAVVTVMEEASFFLDSGASSLPLGAAKLAYGALAPAITGSVDRIALDIFQDGTLLASLGPGSTAGALPLALDHQYRLALSFGASVPFGTDPPFGFVFDVTLAPTFVPEPATLGLLGLGLATLAGAGRRRGRRGALSTALPAHQRSGSGLAITIASRSIST